MRCPSGQLGWDLRQPRLHWQGPQILAGLSRSRQTGPDGCRGVVQHGGDGQAFAHPPRTLHAGEPLHTPSRGELLDPDVCQRRARPQTASEEHKEGDSGPQSRHEGSRVESVVGLNTDGVGHTPVGYQRGVACQQIGTKQAHHNGRVRHKSKRVVGRPLLLPNPSGGALTRGCPKKQQSRRVHSRPEEILDAVCR